MAAFFPCQLIAFCFCIFLLFFNVFYRFPCFFWFIFIIIRITSRIVSIYLIMFQVAADIFNDFLKRPVYCTGSSFLRPVFRFRFVSIIIWNISMILPSRLHRTYVKDCFLPMSGTPNPNGSPKILNFFSDTVFSGWDSGEMQFLAPFCLAASHLLSKSS